MEKKIKTSKKITKKTQVVGNRQLVDIVTGEEINAIETIQETSDINWHKVWITHLIQALDIVGNKKMKVVNYILDNLDWSTNMLVKTQKEIADDTGVGFNTVNSTIQKLLEVQFLKKKVGGVYMLNPDILAYGGHSKRHHLLITFQQFGENKNEN